MNTRNNLFAFGCALAILTPTTQAAITVTNSMASAGTTGGYRENVTHTISNWDLAGGNALVVLFGGDNTNEITATFAGQEMLVGNNYNNTGQLSSIAYIINPTATSGDIVINAERAFGNTIHSAYGIVSLSDVEQRGALSGRASTGNIAYNTLSEGAYVLGVSQSTTTHSTIRPSIVGHTDTELFSDVVDNSFMATMAHGDVPIAGSHQIHMGYTSSSSLIISFEPVPEPSSLALVAFGGLLIARHRRR